MQYKLNGYKLGSKRTLNSLDVPNLKFPLIVNQWSPGTVWKEPTVNIEGHEISSAYFNYSNK